VHNYLELLLISDYTLFEGNAVKKSPRLRSPIETVIAGVSNSNSTPRISQKASMKVMDNSKIIDIDSASFPSREKYCFRRTII
jgi:hypothetical protein